MRNYSNYTLEITDWDMAMLAIYVKVSGCSFWPTKQEKMAQSQTRLKKKGPLNYSVLGAIAIIAISTFITFKSCGSFTPWNISVIICLFQDLKFLRAAHHWSWKSLESLWMQWDQWETPCRCPLDDQCYKFLWLLWKGERMGWSSLSRKKR